MPRAITPGVSAEAGKAENRPVELYQVYLDEATLFFAVHPENVEFYDENGTPTTYYALGLSRSPVRTNMDTKVDEVTVQLDNVTREMSAYIAHAEFVGRRLKIIKVFLDHLESPEDYVTVFDGIMDAPVINETAMQVAVVSKLDLLGFRVPRRRYQRPCNWKFGSAQCGADPGVVAGTVVSISPDGLTLTLSGRAEGTGYYRDGVLTIEGQWQRVLSSNGATFTVSYPFVGVEPDDTYSLRRGCDKSLETCRDRFGNQSNYGGFLSIPAERTIRS